MLNFAQKYAFSKIECMKIIQFSLKKNDLTHFKIIYLEGIFNFVEQKTKSAYKINLFINLKN